MNERPLPGCNSIRDLARALIASVGGVDITVEGKPWFKLS